MNDLPTLSRFELAARELRAQGITITRLPGEYRVNYLNGSEATATSHAEFEEAIAFARELAKSVLAAAARDATSKRPAADFRSLMPITCSCLATSKLYK